MNQTVLGTIAIPSSVCTYSLFDTPPIEFSALADGLHFIRGIGNGEKVGDKFYTATAIVTPEKDVVRSRFYGEPIYYSKWTDEQRAAEIARLEKEQQEIQKAHEEREKEREALLDAARRKLTTEEYEAVYNEGYADGRD